MLHLHQFFGGTNHRGCHASLRVNPLDDGYDAAAGDVRAIPRYKVVHSMPSCQRKVVGIRHGCSRDFYRLEIQTCQVMHILVNAQNRKMGHLAQTTFPLFLVPSGYFLKNRRRHVSVTLWENEFPPLGCNLLVRCDQQIPTSRCRQVTDNTRLDINAGLDHCDAPNPFADAVRSRAHASPIASGVRRPPHSSPSVSHAIPAGIRSSTCHTMTRVPRKANVPWQIFGSATMKRPIDFGG